MSKPSKPCSASADYRIIHLSDLHFTKPIFPRDFWTKRMLGYLNLKLFRRGLFRKWRIVERKLLKEHWDLLLISGDLTNLGQKLEFEQAKKLLEPYCKQGKLVVLPGNHDRYAKESMQQDWMKKIFGQECPISAKNREHKPFFIEELQPGLLLVGLDMSKPRPLFNATGSMPKNWQAELKKALEPYQSWVKIATGHYPLQPTLVLHEVKNYKQILSFLLQQGISLYLHGHIHHSQVVNVESIRLVNSAGWNGYHRILVNQSNLQVEFCALK